MDQRLPWGISRPQQGSIDTLSKEKVESFYRGSSGASTTKGQKERREEEEREVKRQREEEETARVYKDYLSTFDRRRSRRRRRSYSRSRSSRSSSYSRSRSRSRSRSSSPPARTSARPQDSSASRKRNLDSFLEEIKRNHDGSFHSDQHQTRRRRGHDDYAEEPVLSTNLFVSNIHPEVTEIMLCQLFGVHGPIASAKIMWPRTEAELNEGRNKGFVCFMDRSDAACALNEIDGHDVLGLPLRVGWAKPVPLPAQPIFVHEGAPNRSKKTLALTQMIVQIPNDEIVRRRIHLVIQNVLQYGEAFESAIARKEHLNPAFRFLSDYQSPEHIYYRWKMYSLLQGDQTDSWRCLPFRMVEDGSIQWLPPSLEFKESFSDDDGSEKHENEVLDWDSQPEESGELDAKVMSKFRNLLRKCTLERWRIGEIMVFAMDHAFAAEEIVETLVQSIVSPETPVYPCKVGRLFAVSDIVLNSMSAQESDQRAYRPILESKLPVVFEHFNTLYRSTDARLRAEQLKRSVFLVLDAWETATIFPAAYTERLKATFLRQMDMYDPNGSGLLHPSLVGTIAESKDTVKELLSASTQQQTDMEKQELREIERKVAQFTEELSRKSQSRFASYQDRLKKSEIAQRAQTYREQLLKEIEQSKCKKEDDGKEQREKEAMKKFKRIG